MKPYAESCDQNREPILAVIRSLFADRATVLERCRQIIEYSVGEKLNRLVRVPSITCFT
jgi:hypothetical protein